MALLQLRGLASAFSSRWHRSRQVYYAPTYNPLKQPNTQFSSAKYAGSQPEIATLNFPPIKPKHRSIGHTATQCSSTRTWGRSVSIHPKVSLATCAGSQPGIAGLSVPPQRPRQPFFTCMCICACALVCVIAYLGG